MYSFDASGCNSGDSLITIYSSQSVSCKSSWRNSLGSYENYVADGVVRLVSNDWARCGSRNKVRRDLSRWLDRPKQKRETGRLRKSETAR